MTYLTQELIQQGYIGATGSTPYSAGSVSQVSTLQGQYNTALVGQMLVRPPTAAIQITLNFDGTQNNKEFVPDRYSQTNVARLSELTGDGVNLPSFSMRLSDMQLDSRIQVLDQ